MSNICMYEIEDNMWDEIGENDDHTVPHSGNKHENQFIIQDDCSTKSPHELHGIRSSENVGSYHTQGKEELYLQNLTQKERMLEKGSWSDKAEGMFSSCDKEAKRLTSDDTAMSDHCLKSNNIDSGGREFCADETILADKCAVEDDSVCQYPIHHVTQADNELSFLDNDEWPGIGLFEDVDRMLSCDLNVGMGSLNNDEVFSWLSSSHDVEGSDDVLKSDFKFSCAEMSPLTSMLDYNLDSRENIEFLPINGSNKRSSPHDKKILSQMDVDDYGIPAPLSIFSESDMKSGTKDDLVHKEKRKLPKQSAGSRKNGYQENGDSVHPYTPPEQYVDIKQPFGASSSGVTSLDSIQEHMLNIDFDSFDCIQTQIPIKHPDFSPTPNHTSVFPTLSGPRSEHDWHLSPSLKESSYVSNMESSHGHSLDAAAMKTNEKRGKLHHSRDGHMSSRSFNFKNENMANEMPFPSPESGRQVTHEFENEGHSEVRGVSGGFSPEMDSSTVQESSPMSSALGQTSLEASSFSHLQQTLDQLDIRTKLCIRDSLYRLAKSAEQRHDNANTNGCIGDDSEACQAMAAQDASRCTGFMDIETDTNPIDRSIAQLLFHRPSDPSTLLPNHTVPSKSSAKIHGPVINPPVTTEKQVCLEDSSTGVESKFLGGST